MPLSTREKDGDEEERRGRISKVCLTMLFIASIDSRVGQDICLIHPPLGVSGPVISYSH